MSKVLERGFSVIRPHTLHDAVDAEVDTLNKKPAQFLLAGHATTI